MGEEVDGGSVDRGKEGDWILTRLYDATPTVSNEASLDS